LSALVVVTRFAMWLLSLLINCGSSGRLYGRTRHTIRPRKACRPRKGKATEPRVILASLHVGLRIEQDHTRLRRSADLHERGTRLQARELAVGLDDATEIFLQ